MVKNLPAMQETQVLSLGWEDPLGEISITSDTQMTPPLRQKVKN